MRGTCPYCGRYTTGDICSAHGYVGAPKKPEDSSFPFRGVMVMYSGLVANIKPGWQLCDGTNGTPNLSGKFVLGSSGDAGANPTGQTGGSNAAHTHTLSVTGTVAGTSGAGSSHTHAVTVTSHGYDVTGAGGGHNHGGVTAGPGTTMVHPQGTSTDRTFPHYTHTHVITSQATHQHSTPILAHTVTNPGEASHTHPLTTGTCAASGTSGSTSGVPAYYASAIIIYLGG